jgi:hypothetical protein
LVGIPEQKTRHGIPRLKWENDSEMDVREIGWGCTDWIIMNVGEIQGRGIENRVTSNSVP